MQSSSSAPQASASRRIVEVTLFWNEDLIFAERIRNTLAYADAVYVAEGNESHSGLVKHAEYRFPKLLAALKSQAPELDLNRVHFVPVDLANVKTDAFIRERTVRDAAFAEVVKQNALRPQDVLIVQDFDEFLHPDARAEVLSLLSAFRFLRKALRLRYRMTYYHLNLLEDNSGWDLVLAIKGTVALRPGFSPNFYRHSIRKKAIATSSNFLGWHHSYLGSTETIFEKTRSIAEATIPVAEIKESEIIERRKNGQDLYGRDFKYHAVDYAELKGIPSLLSRKDLLTS